MHVEQLFNYGSAVRKVMYTTNSIESVNSSFEFYIKKLCLFRTKHVGTGISCGAARTSVPVPMCFAAGSEQLHEKTKNGKRKPSILAVDKCSFFCCNALNLAILQVT